MIETKTVITDDLCEGMTLVSDVDGVMVEDYVAEIDWRNPFIASIWVYRNGSDHCHEILAGYNAPLVIRSNLDSSGRLIYRNLEL